MLTIQPGLYFSRAAVDAANWCGLTDDDVAADIAIVLDENAPWDAMRDIVAVSDAYLAGVIRMASDLAGECAFYRYG